MVQLRVLTLAEPPSYIPKVAYNEAAHSMLSSYLVNNIWSRQSMLLSPSINIAKQFHGRVSGHSLHNLLKNLS